MGKLTSALALWAAGAACGGPPPPSVPTQVPSTTKTFEPLGHRTDAKTAHQAVILGTDDKNGSTVIKLPASDAKDTVDAMFVRLGGGQPASGGSSPVILTTGPNSERTVQVGIYEELAGGAGLQWRAGVWVSAIIAAQTLGKDLTDFKFSASSGGYIDGASASGLMTGGFLATLTGAKIDPSVTMTGIINPDGTIGPVGGIPEKFKGSIDKGKKRLGYPIGMRSARSAATGQMVDLVELAKQNGAEAVEITSVYDAYKLLTGKMLPEPVPVPASEMALDPETVTSLTSKYDEWKKKVGQQWAGLLQLEQAGRLPPALLAMAAMAKERAERADKLHHQNALAAAYAKMLEAWVYATAATDIFEVLGKIQQGDVVGAMKVIDRLDELDKQTIALFKKVGEMRPSTMGGHLLMLGAYQGALRAYGFKMFATESLNNARRLLLTLSRVDEAELRSPEVANKIVEQVAPTIVLVGMTTVETVVANQRLEFESEKSINYMCNIPNVKRMTTSYQSAGAAGINYFETLIVTPLAEQFGIPIDNARQRLAMREPNYLVAFVLSRMDQATAGPIADLKKDLGDKSLQWNLMSLAGSELAYAKASELVAKYYSLGVKTDPATGKAAGVEYERAFLNMLVLAERNARANARVARIATGGIPVQAKLAYQVALVQRDGDLDEKLGALANFWSSSAYSQTAAMLARN